MLTVPYEDRYISDIESVTSNDENETMVVTEKTINGDDKQSKRSNLRNIRKNVESNDRFRVKTSKNFQDSDCQKRYTKFSKRRKSLPSGTSSNRELQPITLIPRGPLICSNAETFKNWPIDSSPRTEIATKSVEIVDSNSELNEKNTDEVFDKIEVKTQISNLKNRTRHLTISHFPDSLNYDVNIIKTNVYNGAPLSKKNRNLSRQSTHLSEDAKKHTRLDLCSNDFVGYFNMNNEITDRSTEDDNKRGILMKLIETENVG